MAIPLEDTHIDVIGKAQRGLGLSDELLAERLSISLERLKQLKQGAVDEGFLLRLAEVLQLKGGALVDLAEARRPLREIEVPGLFMATTPYGEMTVNAYLVCDRTGGVAAAFDTGADADPILQQLSDQKLRLENLFLSHSHGDHILDMDRVREKTGASAWIHEREAVTGAQTFSEGKVFEVGRLRVETRLTCGHSRGGVTYVIQGLDQPVAIVGDALFASSMGGGMVSYQEALTTNRTEIFSLPDNTVLCPGHGPLTTVGLEKRYNPFFPEFT